MSEILFVSPQDLARTYSGRAYEDPWEMVEDCQEFLEYRGRKPNAGSQAVASALELPRGRVRPWIDDGAIPSPVQGIQTAESQDWIPLTEGSDCFDPINLLVAWVCSRGTIKPDTFSPYIRIECDDDRDLLEQTLAELDLDVLEFRTDESHRSTEITISGDGAVFGRVLSCLGAPMDDESSAIVPQYLTDVSEDARRTFARVYLENRATYWSFNDRWLIEHQNRSDRYRKSLSTFFERLGAETQVHKDTISIDNLFVEKMGIES